MRATVEIRRAASVRRRMAPQIHLCGSHLDPQSLPDWIASHIRTFEHLHATLICWFPTI